MTEDFKVTIVQEAKIDALIRVFSCFSFLKNISIPKDEAMSWDINGSHSYCIQAMFIGKTGYGKSTSLNRICGQELFKTDDIKSCTKTVFSAEYKIHNTKNNYFSLCDLPGMGESIDTDRVYAEYYTKMLEKSHCVIYVMRADQRDYAKDREILEPMLNNQKQIKKILLAVNFIDKIEPISRLSPFYPNKQQEINIEKKLFEIQRIFNIPQENIVFYSATEGYNLDKIAEGIINIIKKAAGTASNKNPAASHNKKKLYVGNLSYNTTEESFRNYFSGYGNVVYSKIITDPETGCSRGFGFIEMGSAREAMAAIASTNGAEFEGRILRVNEAIEKPRLERLR